MVNLSGTLTEWYKLIRKLIPVLTSTVYQLINHYANIRNRFLNPSNNVFRHWFKLSNPNFQPNQQALF